MSSYEALSESMENYLKAIFLIEMEKQAARAKDIAKRLGVGNSSVTGALHTLSGKGLINHAPYDLVTLTPKGREIAADVVKRHDALCSFMVGVLGIEPDEARETACRMEHVVSPTVLERLIQFVHFVDSCPEVGPKWVEHRGYTCRERQPHEACDHCRTLPVEQTVDSGQAASSAPQLGKPLSKIPLGTRARVVKVAASAEIKHRLVEMGITPGTTIEVVRVAPMGDPIEVRVRGFALSLRKAEASSIMATPLAGS